MTDRPTLTISDLGDVREVRIEGPAFYHGTWHDGTSSFRTPYQRDTIEAIYGLKAYHLLDEINRVEDAGYLKDQFISFLLRVTPLRGKTVLDFGSGCSGSSILLAREGAARVHAIELVEGLRKAARLRIRDEGLSDVVAVDDAASMTDLPYAKEYFDVIALNAVVEHMKPEEREPILHHLCSLLTAGGSLVITETPNRIYPYDSHTTRLPLISWMPLGLACRTARAIRRDEFGKKSDADMIYDGIVGSTFWRLRRTLPAGMEPAPLDPRVEHEAYFSRLRKRKRGGDLQWSRRSRHPSGRSRAGSPRPAAPCR